MGKKDRKIKEAEKGYMVRKGKTNNGEKIVLERKKERYSTSTYGDKIGGR